MLANSFMDWNVLAMFESIGENSKRQSLGFRDCLFASGAVRKYSGKIDHFADPATIVFTLDLNHEIAHSTNRTTLLQTRKPLPSGIHVQPRGAFTCQHT